MAPVSLPPTLAVICGATTGQLIVATGKIRRNEQEFTPTEFERLGGKAAAKKWKQSIRLLEYEQDGQVSMNTLGLGDWLVQHGLDIRANLLNVVTGPAAMASPSPAPPAIPLPPLQHPSEHIASHTLQHLQHLQRQQQLQQPGQQQHTPPPGYSPQLSPPATEDAWQPAAAAGSGVPQASFARPSASRPQEEALATMQAYLEGRPLPCTPLALELGREVAHLRVCGQAVDLRLLYVMVRDAGGYQAVQRSKAWGFLAAQCVQQQQQQQQQQSTAFACKEPCSLGGDTILGHRNGSLNSKHGLPPIRFSGPTQEAAGNVDHSHASNTSPNPRGNMSPRDMLPSPFLQLRTSPSSVHTSLLCSGVRTAYERFLLRVERKEQLLLQCGLGGFPVATAAGAAAVVPTAQHSHEGALPLPRSQPTLSASASLLLSPSLDERCTTAAAAEGMDVEPSLHQQQQQQQQEQQLEGSSRMHATEGANLQRAANTAQGPFSQASPFLPSFLSSPLPQPSNTLRPQPLPQPRPPPAVPPATATAAAAAVAASHQAQSSLHRVRHTLSATKMHGGSGPLMRRKSSQVRQGRRSFSPAGVDLAVWDSAAAAAAATAAAASGAAVGAQEGVGGGVRVKAGPLLAGQRSLLCEYTHELASSVVDTTSDGGSGSRGSGDLAAVSPLSPSPASQGQMNHMGRAGSCPHTQQLLLQQAAALSLGSSGGSGEFGAGVGGGVGSGQGGDGAWNLGGSGGGEGVLGSSRLRRGSGELCRSGDGSVGGEGSGGGGDRDRDSGGGVSGGGASSSKGEVRAPKRSYEELQSNFGASCGGGDVSGAATNANGREGEEDKGEAVEAANAGSPHAYHVGARLACKQQVPKRMLSLNAETTQQTRTQVGVLLHQLGSGRGTANTPHPSAHSSGPLPPTAAHPHFAWQQQQQQQQQQPSFSSAPQFGFPPHHPTLSSPMAAQHTAAFASLQAQQPRMQPPMLSSKGGYANGSRAEVAQQQAAQLPRTLSAHSGPLTAKGGLGWNAGGGVASAAAAAAATGGCGDAAVAGGGVSGHGLWGAPGPGSGPDMDTLLASDMFGEQQEEDNWEGLMELISEGSKGSQPNLCVGLGLGSGNNTAGSSNNSQQLPAAAAMMGQSGGLHGAVLQHQQLLDNAAATAAAAAATAAAHAANHAAQHRGPSMLAHQPHHHQEHPQLMHVNQPAHHVPLLQPCNSGSSSNTTNDATASANGTEGGIGSSGPTFAPQQDSNMGGARADTARPPAVPAAWMVMQGSKPHSHSSNTGVGALAEPHSAPAAAAAHTILHAAVAATPPMMDASQIQAQPPTHSTDVHLLHELIQDLNG